MVTEFIFLGVINYIFNDRVYQWNKKGGVVHWTHREPNSRHVHGWLKHKGKLYQ